MRKTGTRRARGTEEQENEKENKLVKMLSAHAGFTFRTISLKSKLS